MQSENIIGKFCADVHKEWLAFKNYMLSLDTQSVFDKSYKITFYNEINSFADYVEYEYYMLEQADITDSEMVKILKQGDICNNLWEVFSNTDETMPINYETIVFLLEQWAYKFRN